MNRSIDFYFDFISPYSYIAFKKIIFLEKKNKLSINYKPILLGGLHNLGGITAPAFNERKLRNMKDDCELVARKNNIDFKWNTNFPVNSLYLMRGYILIKEEIKERFFNVCFEAYWKNNIDISKKNNLDEILNLCDLNKNEFYTGIEDIKIKNELKDLTKNAFEKNIFGAPTFVINNKIFWGQDRLEYVLDEYYA